MDGFTFDWIRVNAYCRKSPAHQHFHRFRISGLSISMVTVNAVVLIALRGVLIQPFVLIRKSIDSGYIILPDEFYSNSGEKKLKSHDHKSHDHKSTIANGTE